MTIINVINYFIIMATEIQGKVLKMPPSETFSIKNGKYFFK